jgi:dynein assembly factor with WDR repeat domains 1
MLPKHALPWQVLRAHILPLTNCAFNKSGDRFITGSYDRTCKVGAAVAL